MLWRPLGAAALIVVLTCGADGPRPATTQADASLPPYWEPVAAYIVAQRGAAPTRVSLVQVATRPGPEGRAIREAMLRSTRGLSDEVARAFAGALALLAPPPPLPGAAPLRTQQYVFDTWDTNLFAAEVRLFEQQLRAASELFVRFPPPSEDERRKIKAQIATFLARLREEWKRAGLDAANVDYVISTYREEFEILTSPAAYGTRFRPLSAAAMEQLEKEVRTAVAARADAVRGQRDSECRLAAAQLEALYRAMISGPQTQDARVAELVADVHAARDRVRAILKGFSPPEEESVGSPTPVTSRSLPPWMRSER